MAGEAAAADIALVTFGSARAAARRVAGVAAAGRIVHELAEAGFAEARLELPAGERLRAAAMKDIRHLAGAMKVEIGPPAPAEGPIGEDILRLSGDLLLPAAALRDRGGADGQEAIRLDRRGASAEILRRTGKAGDGPVSRWLNRPVSRFLSALLLRVPGLRPIHATLGTIVLAGLMFAALLDGSAAGLVAGGLLFQAASIFDGVDGEVARATFRSSPAGAVLDSVVDVATNVLFVLGLAIHLGSRGSVWAFALTAWGFLLFLLGLALIAWRASRVDGPFSLDMVKHDYRHRFSGRLVPWLIEAATIVSSRDFFALLFALLILAGIPMAALVLFAGAATVWILFVIGSLRLAEKPTLASRSV